MFLCICALVFGCCGENELLWLKWVGMVKVNGVLIRIDNANELKKVRGIGGRYGERGQVFFRHSALSPRLLDL
jgi:hypothetical protein